MKISVWKLKICIGTHPKQASFDRPIGRHDPGLHEAVRIGLAATLGDGEQYAQDICVVGLVERRSLSGDAVTPRRSPPF